MTIDTWIYPEDNNEVLTEAEIEHSKLFEPDKAEDIEIF
jgi:hypothetical protein